MANTTVLTFKSRLYEPLARNDSIVDGFILQGLNFACTLISLLFQPPDLQTSGTLTISASLSSYSLSSLTRLQTINHIYNTSGSNIVWPIDFHSLDLCSPLAAAAAVYTKFYSRYGGTLYIRPLSSLENSLTVYYSQYPLVLTEDGDEVGFANYDSQIEAYALTYALTCLEETDTAAVWQKLGELIAVPQNILLMTRQKLEEGPIYGNNTK